MKLDLSRKQKRNFYRILICLVAFLILLVIDKTVWIEGRVGGEYGFLLPFFLYLGIYIAIGYDVIWKAVRNVGHLQLFDENFLMCIATLGAFALAIFRGVRGEEIEGFDEACAVLLFYQIGEFFQSYATGKSRKSIAALMEIRPDFARAARETGLIEVAPEEVAVGERIVVYPGERVPLDGVVLTGESALDVKALTGESLPRGVKAGEPILSGAVCLDGTLEIEVSKPFYDSTVSKILDLVENAASQKSKTEHFITRFAKYYTPAVTVAALALAVIPGAITGEWSVWIYRALSFLVVSCPCALVISIPLGFFAGIGAASKRGILIKGSQYLELLNRANRFVFDKTGTLTKGNFAVVKAEPQEKREEILRLAANAERGSSHPIGRSILAAYGEEPEEGYEQRNISGEGVIALKEGVRIACGNEKLMAREGVTVQKLEGAGSAVYVAQNGVFVGAILVADEPKEDAAAVLSALAKMGCSSTMLSGDNEAIVSAVAKELGVDSYRASLLPGDKVEEIEKILAQKGKKEAVCFVGDGVNDAPVLSRADIGIAMGGVGSDAAIEASDVVLMRDSLSALPLAKRVAKSTMRIVTENIVFSLVVKAMILLLSALGITNMWIAVFGDVGVAVLAILNSMRLGIAKFEEKEERK